MFSAALIAALAAALPQGPRLEIVLAFDGCPPSSLQASVVDEAARVWAPYGVVLQPAAPAGAGPITLRVSIVERPGPGVNEHALGSIEFHDGIPEPVISLYAITAGDVITSASGNVSHWPVSYYNMILGRVLGRALAHEIGHFVLQSREHATHGLMRATPPILELMGLSDPWLTLSAEEEAELNQSLLHSRDS